MRRLSAAAAHCTAAALAFTVILGAASHAQEISRPIRIVVPFAPTGFPDRLGRVLAKYLSDSLNQRVYVENKPGAGGILGSVDVAHSAPDGTSLLISSLPSQVITPLINANTGFDTFENFTHIAYIGGPPNCFVSTVGGKFNTFDDLVKTSRTTPQSYGSAGVGTLGNIFAEYVARKAGLKFIHVPYNGPMIADIISGTVDFGSLTMSTVVGNIQGGKLRGLAVASDKRLADFPDVPTFRDLGFDISAVNWLALSGPAGMPESLVKRTNHDVIDALGKPEVRDILRQELIEPIPMSPSDVVKLMKSETERWAPVVAAAGLGK